jgi:hypothetical protein
LIALLVALAVVVVVSLHPWTPDSVTPGVSVAPGVGIALDDAVAVAHGESPAVASARLVAGGKSKLVAEDRTPADGASHPQLDVGPALAVARSRPVRPPQGLPEQPSPAPGSSAPGPAAIPVAAPAPVPEPVTPLPGRTAPGKGGQSGGPVAAGPGPIAPDPDNTVEVREGDEHALAFSFYVQPTAYRAPRDDNLILRFADESDESPNFGLQLWDDGSGSQRGLWASGEAVGGERFIAAVEEGTWHEAVFYFQASSEEDGFYLLTLDGQPIDARAWISLIDPGSSFAQLEVGLFRDGERVVAPADILFGPARLLDAS